MTDKTPERIALEKEADELDLKVPGNIGDEKLKARIEEAKAALNGSGAADAQAAGEQTSPQASGNLAAPAATQPPKPKGKKAGLMTVIGPKAGFWRAGIRFSDAPQSFEPGDLTDAQIKAITDEPKLVVTTNATTE